ncbi:carbohydrate ABC transporter permease [Microbacterium maritypicum]|uniref:carbohydrate ABC transporter permease n=1 Tax=Microbacterium maritypicum TaxID=33918 RepID=UPI00382632A9
MTTTPVHPRRRGPRLGFGRIVSWVYLGIVMIVTVFPFYWILRTALSNNKALAADPSSLLPVDFTVEAFRRVLGIATLAEAQAQGGNVAGFDIGIYLRNSVIYAGISTVLVVLFSTLAAYAFSRLEWRGRNVVFAILMVALMVPGIMTLLPNFVLIKQLGLVNTFTGMILPGALFSAFNIFFLRQFFLGISREVEEAAIIDGAGRLRVMFRIIMPMAQGPIITLMILGFIGAWNDYFWPLLVSTSGDEVRPLTLALAVFRQSAPGTATDWAGLMAAALIAAIPMFLIFLVFGRRIVNSIGFSGVR